MEKLATPLVATALVLLFLFVRYWLRPFLIEAIRGYQEERRKCKRDNDGFFTDLVRERREHLIHRSTIF